MAYGAFANGALTLKHGQRLVPLRRQAFDLERPARFSNSQVQLNRGKTTDQASSTKDGTQMIRDTPEAKTWALYEITRNPIGAPRKMLEGVLWVLYLGAAWRDMPERFGP